MLWFLAFVAYGLMWAFAAVAVYRYLDPVEDYYWDAAWSLVAGAFWPLLLVSWALIKVATPRDH